MFGINKKDLQTIIWNIFSSSTAVERYNNWSCFCFMCFIDISLITVQNGVLGFVHDHYDHVTLRIRVLCGGGSRSQFDSGLPQACIQLQSFQNRFARPTVLGHNQRHVLLGTMRLKRGNDLFINYLNLSSVVSKDSTSSLNGRHLLSIDSSLD